MKMRNYLIAASFIFVVGPFSSPPSAIAAGFFTAETCEGSRSFAKRVFLTKQAGSSYAKYREIEGNPPPGKAGELIGKIEEAIFTNRKITSESLASEYAYTLCITWPK